MAIIGQPYGCRPADSMFFAELANSGSVIRPVVGRRRTPLEGEDDPAVPVELSDDLLSAMA